jgi:DNA-binding NarL/FixJ family response regulator
MTRIRVAVADDHPVVLEGVKALLRSCPELELVGEANDGLAALSLICEARPDVAVIDISMPDMNGVELAHSLAERCPSVKVIALTVHESRAYLKPLIEAGARGYLLKRSAADQLPRAIRAVVEGGFYLDPAVAEKAVVAQGAAADGAAASIEDLSPREAAVLKLIAQGFSNKEIATKLRLSVKSVETYKTRGIEKKGIRTRAEIVRYAVQEGWFNGERNEAGG